MKKSRDISSTLCVGLFHYIHKGKKEARVIEGGEVILKPTNKGRDTIPWHPSGGKAQSQGVGLFRDKTDVCSTGGVRTDARLSAQGPRLFLVKSTFL